MWEKECVVRYKDFIEKFGDREQAVRQNPTLPCALVMDKLQFAWRGPLTNGILRGLEDTDIVNVAVDMLSALTYLHALGIVHGDVRPQNVVPLSGHGLVPAIFSKWAKCPGETYTAPEFAGRGRYKPTRESDVWMLGTMLQELHNSRCKRIPQPISAYSEFLTRKGACEYPAVKVWHDWLEALVAKLLQDKPGDRPRAEDALTALLEEKFRATEGGQVGAEKRKMKEAIKKAKAESTTHDSHFKMTPTYHNLTGVPDKAGRANRYTTTGLKRDGYRKNVYELHDGHQLNAEQGQNNLMFIKFVGRSPEEKSELERFAKEEVSLGEDTAFESVVRYKDYIEEQDMLVVEEADWRGIEPGTYMSDQELLYLAKDILSALTYLHDRGQVHGYVHPSNIIPFERLETADPDKRRGFKLIGHGLVPKVMWTWKDLPGGRFTPPEFRNKQPNIRNDHLHDRSSSRSVVTPAPVLSITTH
ncbi:Calcium/calmodulin-dependent protein kinase II [Colletotrichum sp. SAR 10_76]|nr:Calcium/calmodulin-dependent protein kinase II [Colletotrichum sp. SAR 10_76]